MSYYDESDDDPCDLECVREKKGREQLTVVHEYEGPVKITLVDLIDAGFWPRIWGSALITLANLYIACVVATMVFFSLTFQLPIAVNAHIAACMAGFQLLMPTGILMLNPLFGPASQMLGSSRENQHIFLQLCAIVFICAGSTHVCTSIEVIKLNPHTITGFMAVIFACCTVILGMIHYSLKPKIRFPHTVCGIITYMMSSVCTCMALIRPSFVSWCTTGLIPEVPYILIALCALYTAFIIMAVKCRVHERNKFP